MGGTRGIEQRTALTGFRPHIADFNGHSVVQVDLRQGRKKPVGHLFIPRDKVPDEVFVQIQNKRVKALVLNDPQGSWEITNVRLRPGSNSK